MSYKFTKTPDPRNTHDVASVEIYIAENEITMPVLLREFGYFLLGCGYSREKIEEAIGFEALIEGAE